MSGGNKLPSLPKNGESLMVNSMLMVGSSMAIFGNASGKSKSAMVSPISKPSMPTIAQMSPAQPYLLLLYLDLQKGIVP